MGSQQKRNSSFLLQGTILAAAGIITRIIGAVYRIPLADILGNDGVGFYGYAFQIYNLALILTSYSLPLAVSKLVSARTSKGEYKNAMRILKGALTFAISVGLIVALIIFFGSNFISSVILKASLTTYALRVLAPCLFIVAILGVMRGYFQGLGTMMPTAISQVLEQIINAVVSIVGASYLFQMGKEVAKKTAGSNLTGPAYGAAGGTLGTLMGALTALLFMFFIFYAYRKVMKRQLKRDRSGRKESYREIFVILLLTIAPVILSTAIYNISEAVDSVMFNNIMHAQGYKTKEYVAMWGMFNNYNTLVNIPLAMANALGASVVPSLTAVVSSGTRKQIHGKLHLAVRFVMLIAIPSCVGLIVLAEPIISLLYPNGDISTTTMMLRLGGVSVVFFCLSTVTNALLQGLNRMTVPVKNAAVSLVIHIVCVLIMLVIFKWKIYSIILGNVIFSLSMCILNGKALAKYARYVQEVKKTFLIPIASAVIMGVTALLVQLLCVLFIGNKIATVIAIIFAVMAYGISLLKLGGLSQDEVLALPKGTMLLNLFNKLHLMKRENF